MSDWQMPCPEHEGKYLVKVDGVWWPESMPGRVCTTECVPVHLREHKVEEPAPESTRFRRRVDDIKFEMDAREQAEDERVRVDDLPLVWDDEDEPEEMLGQVVWGTPNFPLAHTGQPLVISSGDGLGKTTIAQDYVRARLGVYDDMWGLPVVPLAPERNVLYLAFDRYAQIREAWQRGPAVRHRVAFAKQAMWPLRSAKAGPWVLEKVREVNAGLIVVDSLKDQVNSNEVEQLARFWDNMKPPMLAGVEVVVLSHTNKTTVDPENPLTAVSGHRLATSSAGSVLVIGGSAGKPPHTVYHAKALRGDTQAPSLLSFDHATGRTTLHEGAGLVNVDLSRAPAWAWTQDQGIRPEEVLRIQARFEAAGKKEMLTGETVGCTSGSDYTRGVKVLEAMRGAGLLDLRKAPGTARGKLWLRVGW